LTRWSTSGKTWVTSEVDHWPDQCKDKSNYYYYFKTWPGSWSRVTPRSQPGWTIDSSQHDDKKVIIIVLKLDLGVDPGQDPSHESGWPLTHVNIRIKVIIIVLKLIKGWLEPKLGSRAGLTIDLSQCKDKNSYYHSFKTWIGDRFGARHESS
jgi:hypothetical protein